MTQALAKDRGEIDPREVGEPAHPGKAGCKPGFELGGECLKFADLGTKLQSAFGSGSGDIDDVSDVFDELADRVPEEIRDDYQVLADNFKEFAEALEGVDLSSGATPDAETLAKLQQAASSMDQPEVRQASENIEAWVSENC